MDKFHYRRNKSRHYVATLNPPSLPSAALLPHFFFFSLFSRVGLSIVIVAVKGLLGLARDPQVGSPRKGRFEIFFILNQWRRQWLEGSLPTTQPEILSVG